MFRIARHGCWSSPRSPLLAGILLAALSGCQSPLVALRPGWWAARLANSTIENEAEIADPAERPAQNAPVEKDLQVALGDDLATLTDDKWVATVQNPWLNAAPPEHRWRQPGIERLLARPPEERPDLTSAASSANHTLAASTTIALVRLGEQPPAAPLETVIKSSQAHLSLRLAAAEALGRLQQPTARDSLRQLCDRYGRFEEPEDLRLYVAELHGELLRSLARQPTAHDSSRWLAAIESPSALVRLAVVESWPKQEGDGLVDEVLKLRHDPDELVRAATLRAIAAHRTPRAAVLLGEALGDGSLRVRLAAIAALGSLKQDDAGRQLEQLVQHETELVRLRAVEALSNSGAYDKVLAQVDDTSWRVRGEVAKALAQRPQAVGLARRLLLDPSPQVQRHVVDSLAHWPREQSGPLLLEALATPNYLVRQSAREALAAWWEPAKQFAINSPAAEREQLLADLRQRWQREFGALDGQMSEGKIRAVSMGADAAAALAQLRTALDGWQQADIGQRRRWVASLAADSARQLDDATLEQLAGAVMAEPDAQVWRSTLVALENDPREAAARVARAAITHADADIRRRACEHLGSLEQPAHAAALMASLADEDPGVRRAAVRALGRGKAAGAASALEPLLLERDKTLRVDVAVSLARLAAPQGADALARLAVDDDPKIRRQTVIAMGELADAAFLPLLIERLDDQGGVALAALESLALVAGRDVARDPALGPPPENTAQSVARWRQWYADGARLTATAAPARTAGAAPDDNTTRSSTTSTATLRLPVTPR